MMKTLHEKFMREAIALAKKAEGRTSPNPIVGAVIVKNGKIIARGFHSKAGGAHAEIVALKKLKKGEAQGATLYVTLEPCYHDQKKTPPCLPQIIASEVKHVVIGSRDPNPKTHGKAVRALKKRGIKVTEGVLQKEVGALNLPFQKWITTGIPYVTLKVALSLDGKIALANGESKWISNTLCQSYNHQLRDKVDAILVGAGTIRKDDPLLNVRLPKRRPGRQPLLVVVGSPSKIGNKKKIFSIREREIFFAQSQKNGRVDLKGLLKELGKMGVTHILIEGGGQIYSSFIEQKLADKLVLFIAPKLLGGSAMDWLPNLVIPRMKNALELDNISLQILGDNLLIEGSIS
ncbi:MAG: bifunctional diaminohydroxyphosphoribosylaminopyrimidine deaminase/5-amino-6-(5-phosphoribosylamino)uracil reductase RibD [Deltaproteobacteria bacterium]|nr:bifunctional diaminohydroxyphosphoribosylaminopyrimidine deaminase/5-amino-6-(5-phosphoribosylamino)uracil reductase RibD [Deltaproteobacteria bacterium]